MDTPKNPFRRQIEKSKQQIYILAFLMGAVPFLIVMLIQVASYAGIILIVCVVLGAVLRLVQILHRRY